MSSLKKTLAKYPRLGESSTLNKNKQKLCEVCKQPAAKRVTVQWWFMRGDDSVHFVCAHHADLLKTPNSAAFSELEAKD